ncbi:MAG: two-component regulator propeller domain-containing protein, partial [Sphingobacteriales bacterium]
MNTNDVKHFLMSGKRISLSLIFSFFYLLCTTMGLFAQNVENLHIEKVQDEGLSNDYINCISQDSNDFLWFGTREGLFRYDGYGFEAFRNLPGDSTTIINNGINFLYPEKNRLWVGSRGGLSCVDNDTQTLKNFRYHEFLQVYAILPKDDQTFWVGTSTGLFQFNKRNLQWKRISALGKNVFVRSLSDDKKDHLYITTQNGFYRYTESAGTCKYYRPDLPSFPKKDKNSPLTFCTSLLDREGNLWLGTWDAGIAKFNPKTEEIKVWSHQTDDVHLLPYKIATGLLQYDNDNVWIANKEGGLTIFNPSKNKFTNYPVEWNSENKLSGAVIALFRDRSG